MASRSSPWIRNFRSRVSASWFIAPRPLGRLQGFEAPGRGNGSARFVAAGRLLPSAALLRCSTLARSREAPDGRQIGFAGAEQWQLVDADDLGRDHQIGGAFCSGVSLEGGARSVLLLGDK